MLSKNGNVALEAGCEGILVRRILGRVLGNDFDKVVRVRDLGKRLTRGFK